MPHTDFFLLLAALAAASGVVIAVLSRPLRTVLKD
jgi:hypothetical protein